MNQTEDILGSKISNVPEQFVYVSFWMSRKIIPNLEIGRKDNYSFSELSGMCSRPWGAYLILKGMRLLLTRPKWGKLKDWNEQKDYWVTSGEKTGWLAHLSRLSNSMRTVLWMVYELFYNSVSCINRKLWVIRIFLVPRNVNFEDARNWLLSCGYYNPVLNDL